METTAYKMQGGESRALRRTEKKEMLSGGKPNPGTPV